MATAGSAFRRRSPGAGATSAWVSWRDQPAGRSQDGAPRPRAPRSSRGDDGGTLAGPGTRRRRATICSSRRTTAARSSGGPITSAVSPSPTTQSTNVSCSGTTIRRSAAPEGSQASTAAAPSGRPRCEQTVRPRPPSLPSRAAHTLGLLIACACSPRIRAARGGNARLRTSRILRAARRLRTPLGPPRPRNGRPRNLRSPVSGAVLSRPTRYQAVSLNVSPYGSTSRRRPR